MRTATYGQVCQFAILPDKNYESNNQNDAEKIRDEVIPAFNRLEIMVNGYRKYIHFFSKDTPPDG